MKNIVQYAQSIACICLMIVLDCFTGARNDGISKFLVRIERDLRQISDCLIFL